MKKIYKKYRHGALALLLLLAACGDDKPSSSNAASKSDVSFLTATINGEGFSSSLEIVTFKISGQTHIHTADNKLGLNEYEIALIGVDTNTGEERYGSIELKNNGEGIKDKSWMVPKGFNYSMTHDGEGYIEGTFSFTAKDPQSGEELVVTNGSFRANKKGGY